MPVPVPMSTTVEPSHTSASMAARKASSRRSSPSIWACVYVANGRWRAASTASSPWRRNAKSSWSSVFSASDMLHHSVQMLPDGSERLGVGEIEAGCSTACIFKRQPGPLHQQLLDEALLRQQVAEISQQ